MSVDPSAGPGWAVILQLVSTLMMAGLILFVQVVHYPLKSSVGSSAFPAYQRGHTLRTSLVVIPLMVMEMASALWLTLLPPPGVPATVPWVGVALLTVIWGSTALLQAPAHGRLTRGWDDVTHAGLVRSNWIRTAAWILRVPVVLAMAFPRIWG